MKEGWEYKKLGEVCNIQYGYAFDSKCFCDNKDYPQLVRIRDVNRGFSETYYNGTIPDGYDVNRGDYLIGMDGEFNIAQWQSEKALLNQRVCKIWASKDIIDRFMFYNMRVILKQIEEETPFVTVKHLSAKRLNTICLPTPPLSEQQRIVEELDLLSSIIEKKKAQLKELDSLAQSIFYKEYDNYTEQIHISNYISSLGGGKSLAGNEECANKVLKTGAVTYDFFKPDEVKFLPIDYIPRPEHLLKDGDVLISRMNTLEYVGACAYVWKAPLNTYLPDRLWRATLKDNINPVFLWFSLIQESSKKQIRALASGTSGSMKNISIPRFLSIKIKKVPLNKQNAIAIKIEAIEKQKELIKQSIKEVETLFNSRMDYYFN